MGYGMSQLLVFIGLVISTLQHAPSEHPLTKRIDAVVLTMMPEARAEALPMRPRLSEVSDTYYHEHRRWVHGNTSVRALYSIATSVELSKEQFRLLTEMLQVGSVPIDGVGDEARLLEPAPSGERRLNIRRGRVVIQLAAPGPGEETIRRLAGLLVDQVDRSNKARELDNIR
jgi:hypothetical protein